MRDEAWEAPEIDPEVERARLHRVRSVQFLRKGLLLLGASAVTLVGVLFIEFDSPTDQERALLIAVSTLLTLFGGMLACGGLCYRFRLLRLAEFLTLFPTVALWVAAVGVLMVFLTRTFELEKGSTIAIASLLLLLGIWIARRS